MKRKAGAAALAAMALAGFWGRSEYEKKHFKMETFDITSDKLNKPERKLVFLSDLHNNTFGKGNQRLLEAIQAVKPDAVLVGGDMMVCKGERDIRVALRLMRELAGRYPVFYGNGNHESRMERERHVYGTQYEEFVAALKKIGVVYLSDKSAYLDQDIRITGYDLEEKYYRKLITPAMSPGDIKRQVGDCDASRFQILLAHSPLYFDAYAKWGADLTLSGHFHGGTIRLPVVGGVMTPQYQFFLPWCGGAFAKDGREMIVSRGLGTHSINIRFNNKPQVVVVRLRARQHFLLSL